MHVYSEKDPVEIKVNDSVLSVACVFSKRKLMHAVKDLILEDCTVLKDDHALGREIIHLVEGNSSTRNNTRKQELGGQRGRLERSQDCP